MPTNDQDALAGRVTEHQGELVVPALRRLAEKRQAATTQVRYHSVRVPIYALMVIGFFGLGSWVMVREGLPRYWRWITFAESELDPGHREHIKERKRRREATMLTGGALAAAGIWAYVALGWVPFAALAAVVFVSLAVIGKPRDMQVVNTDPAGRTEVTATRIADAFADLGNWPDGADIDLIIDLHKVDGAVPGRACRVELPYLFGGTADEWIARRGELAGLLRLPADRLEMSKVVGGHESELDMWIADFNPWSRDWPDFPLTSAEKWSVWDGAMVGVRARGERVTMHAVGKSGLIVSVPGYGKSAAAQILASNYVLDPRARILGVNGKGGVDLRSLRKVAFGYIHGEGYEQLADLADLLEAEVARAQRIYDRLTEDEDAYPEGRITRESRIEPTLIIIDEAHKFVPASESRRETTRPQQRILAAIDYLVSEGRAAGYAVWLISQSFTGENFPGWLVKKIGNRWVFKVASPDESSRVTGQSGDAHKAADASKLDKPGVAYVVAAAEKSGLIEPVKALSYRMDIPTFGRICDRGRLLRGEAGALTGYAAEPHGPQAAARPEPPAVELRPFEAAVESVFDEHPDDRISPTELRDLLAERDLSLDLTTLGLAMKAIGCPSRSSGTARWHYRSDVLAEVARLCAGGEPQQFPDRAQRVLDRALGRLGPPVLRVVSGSRQPVVSTEDSLTTPLDGSDLPKHPTDSYLEGEPKSGYTPQTDGEDPPA
jgi:hypothetical protein